MPKINKISSNVVFIYLFLKYLTLIQRPQLAAPSGPQAVLHW